MMNGFGSPNFDMGNVAGGFFNQFSDGDYRELRKALTSGYAITSQTGGGALRMQSLDNVLRVLASRFQDLKFWNAVHKDWASSTTEEYTQLTSYGSSYGPFISESQTPETNDPTLARQTAKVKLMGTMRQHSVVAGLVRTPYEKVETVQTRASVMWLLESMEKHLFGADSSMLYTGGSPTYTESLEFDGLDAFISATQYVDLKGNPPQESDVENAAMAVKQVGIGNPTDLFWSNWAMSDYVKTVYPRERFNMPLAGGRVGYMVSGQDTVAGPINFHADRFLAEGFSPMTHPPDAATHATKAPTITGSPGMSVAGAASSGKVDGDFEKGTGAGPDRYFYKVTACNFYGESLPTAASTAVDITQAEKEAGEHIDLTITNPSVSYGTYPVEWFNIYRTEPLGASATAPSSNADYYFIGRYGALDRSGGGTSNVPDDLNLLLPNTTIGYMLDMDPLVLEFRQLLPLSKLNLPMSGQLYQFMVLLFGVLILTGPSKACRVLNIGRLVRE